MKRNDDKLAFLLKFDNIAWFENGKVRILDRRLYPQHVEFVICENVGEVCDAISNMVTQSAGPYSTAGMGMALAAWQVKDKPKAEQLTFLEEAADMLSNARPTTAHRMRRVVDLCLENAKAYVDSSKPLYEVIFEHTVDALNFRYGKMDEVANSLLKLLPKKSKVMTQCFAETILGTLCRAAEKNGYDIEFFTPETRPYLQGARLTASVLRDQGFKVNLISDNMPAAIMQREKIDVFTSAADSICMDGSVINKIGTFQMAIVAKYLQIPYFVTGLPDLDHKNIGDLKIEYRNPEEVLSFQGCRIAMNGVDALYPAFDITPPHLVSGVVTDIGVLCPYTLGDYYKSEIVKSEECLRKRYPIII